MVVVARFHQQRDRERDGVPRALQVEGNCSIEVLRSEAAPILHEASERGFMQELVVAKEKIQSTSVACTRKL